MYAFAVGPLVWKYDLDDVGLRIRAKRKDVFIPWQNVIAAGSTAPRQTEAADLPTFAPGLTSFLRRSIETSNIMGHLALAYRSTGGRRRYFSGNVSLADNRQTPFIAELKTRLGERWLGESLTLLALRKKLGYSNWWVWAALPVCFVIAFIILGILMDMQFNWLTKIVNLFR